MCGICGMVSVHPLNPTQRDAVRRMNHGMVHRGPDGQGEHAHPRAHLAMRRLSIIDLQGGWQPLYNEDRSLVLVANGEIYNHVELRALLEDRGHAMRTGSDCETILHAYEEFGLDAVDHLRGMFAFALLDTRRQRLMLCRDRLGEKPLYMHRRGEALLFASELKALLRGGLVPFKLDPVGISLYYHYNFTPEPRTVVQGVHKLPAGHLLLFDLETGAQTLREYWNIADAPPLEEPAVPAVRRCLEEVMQVVVRADVPVSVALSGGVDSSAVAAMAAGPCAAAGNPLQAIGIGYPNCPDCDERAMARELAGSLGIVFHEVEISSEELVSFFPQLVVLNDDPVADIAAFSYYCLMRKARELGIPVMLQGHGGDELFWGYPWVAACVEESRAREAQACGSHAPLTLFDKTPGFREAQAVLPGLLTSRTREALPPECALAPQLAAMPWNRPDVLITDLICKIYLAGNGLTQGDRLGMASSVEVRLPFVDHRLAEIVVGLRKTRPDHLQPAKHLLKEALAGVLPRAIMQRPKRGFSPPSDQWVRALRDTWGASILEGWLVQAGILEPRALPPLLHDDALVWRGAPMVYKTMILEHWCRGMAQIAGSGTVIA